MGTYFETFGIPRIGGRILGLLLVAQKPLTADQIGSLLKVSRASISTNFRLLLAGGLAEKVFFPGSRTTFYSFPEKPWEKLITTEIASISALKRLTLQGLEALPPGDSARSRMDEMVKWADYLIQIFQKAHADWIDRQHPSASVVT